MLSTFAMYFPEPRTPLSSDFELINAAGHIARIAIELERSHLALRTRKIDCEPSLTLFPRWLGLPVPTARPNSSTGAGWIMPAYRRKRHRIGAGPLRFTQKTGIGSGIIGGTYWLLGRPVRLKHACAVSTENIAGSSFEEIKQLKDHLHDENVVLREQIDQAFMFEEIVGSSPSLKTVLSSIVKVAPTDSTVLITGETGTGKELIARAIHKSSQRAGQAFIGVNCASIPSSLIASKLFGHEEGAFTGALQLRQGRFELAHSGTIFLDEIGELPAETQIALLRVLQERQFERVGGARVITTDVRIIAATNRDLSAAIAAGAFGGDLFYRLNVFPIDVPPLRNRKEDIPMLVEYFVKRYAEKAGKQISKIDKNTLKLCQSYHWPCNIREL